MAHLLEIGTGIQVDAPNAGPNAIIGVDMELVPLTPKGSPAFLATPKEDISESEEVVKEHHFNGKSRISHAFAWIYAYICEFLYPKSSPWQTQLWRRENIAIPICYLLVGTVEGLSASILNTYPLKIGATEAQQVTIRVLRTLPASFKIVFGFISDAYPIFGYRRKVYLVGGWFVAGISCLVLALMKTPGIQSLSFLMLLNAVGFWFADVMGDSLIAERARFEAPDCKGHIQSTAYACRFFMLMVTVVLSTVLFEVVQPYVIFWSLALIPCICIVIPAYYLEEPKFEDAPSVRAQCRDLWNTVCSRAVWQPMSFIYLYNLFQIGNGAWNQYLYTALKFTTLQINSFMISAYALIFIGIIVYKCFCRNLNWRLLYVITTVLNGFFSLLQFMLIFGLNRKIGISDYVFALGDDVAREFILGMQFLPTAIMMVNLCPQGSEGSAYAMFTTVSNSAANLAGTLSTLLLAIWPVGTEEFAKSPPNVDGFWKLSLLTTVIQVAAIMFIPLLPARAADMANLNFGVKYRIGGFIFLGITVFSLVWALITAILNVVKPGWAGG